MAGESFQHLIPVSAEVEDGVSYIVTNTSKSGLTVCTAVKNVLSKDGEMTSEVSGHQTTTVIKTDIAENETVTLVKYTIYSDSIRHEDCRSDAAAAMERALATPLEEHYASQKAYLKRFWISRRWIFRVMTILPLPQNIIFTSCFSLSAKTSTAILQLKV